MSLVRELVCVACGASVAEGQALTCPKCGPDEGILDVRYDLDAAARTLTRAAMTSRPQSIWRYHELLPLDLPAGGEETLVDRKPPFEPSLRLIDALRIGWTPLTEAPRLAAAIGVRRLRLKDEGREPSASFKDRASAVGVARALQEGAKAIACASTGNAASSLAHCAAAVGLPCNIFVPRGIPGGKLAQLLAYGARVFKVLDSYAAAYALCTQACRKFGWYNRNCAINPYLVEGKKTGGLELAEQCADDPPDWVAVSVGDGCTVAGIGKGLAEMHALGVVSWRARLLGVQAAGVAPVARAFERGRLEPWPQQPDADGGTPDSRGTYADSIDCPVPRNWRKAAGAVRESGGAFVTVRDAQIQEAVRQSGRLAGVFAEPAAAAAVAGIAEAVRRGIVSRDASVVAMITGSGLKDIAGATRAVGAPHEVPAAELSAVEKLVADQR